MWTLRFLSLALIYAGMAMPQIAYTLMVLLVSFRYWGYPLRAFSYIRWCVSSVVVVGALVLLVLGDVRRHTVLTS